jgi:hypothetical protein
LSTYKENNYITTILPSNNNNNNSTTNTSLKSDEHLNPIILLVSISDGLGGITNISYPIIIN